jgi:hypothetical protein
VTVVLNEAALDVLLRSPEGPVARDLDKRALSVAEQARLNASGMVIGVRSGDLREGIQAELIPNPLAAVVRTPARHRGFAYPAFHDRHGRPWLTEALATGFRRNV